MRVMHKSWSLVPLTIAALALGGCSQSQSRQVVGNEAASGGYPARLPMASIALPLEQAPVQPEGAAWRADAAGVHFGVAGQSDLLALACEHAPDGTASVRLSRMTRADEGAKAMFALIGNGRIARLPLDVTRAGEAGEWRGLIPAADARLDVLKGGNRIEGTLPGGGTLLMPASNEPGRLLTACRASDRAPTRT